MCLVPEKRNVRSAIFVFAFIYLYEWFVHEYLLQKSYATTAQLWRTPDSFESYYVYMVIFQILFALWATVLFDRNYENKGIDEGARFGTLLGVGLALTMFAPYLYLPVSLDLGLSWAVVGFVEGLLIGVILSKVHRRAVAVPSKKVAAPVKKKKK